ncbi:helix-turn-helix domain-containing protein [Microbacterium lacticum]
MSDAAAQSDDRLFISERELARELGVHPSTLTRLAQQGKLPVQPVYVGSRRVYPRKALEKLAGVA